jgi:3-oxoacyl-[acyl-carrier protein] reductase
MMFNLSGKTALVTGASGGIGGAIAKALAAQGARVALSGTRVEALEKVQAEIADSVVLPCNLSDAAAVDALVGQAETALGKLDILVANAGITKDGLLLRMKDEDFQNVLRINLESYFRLSRAALKTMMKARWPHHRHHLRRRRDRQSGASELRGFEGRHDWLHQGDGC